MARLRLALRLVLTMTFTFFLVGGSLASAQRPGTSSTEAEGYVSELTDLEVSFSDDWSIDDSEVIEDPAMRENLYLMSDMGILLISFNENLDTDPESLISDILDSLEADAESFDVVDEDSSRGFAWAVFEAELEDGTVVQGYADVDDSFSDDFLVLSMIYAEDADFVDQYELAQGTVEIDGDEIMGEFEVQEIEELIGGGSTSPDENEEEAVEEEGTPEDENVTETGDDGTQSRGASSDTHVFELADLELTVSGDIQINDVQFEEDAYEQILLVGGGAIGAVSVLDSPLDAEDTLDSFMGGFVSEMDDSQEIDSGVDGGVAWTVYEANIGGPMYVYATVSEDRVSGLHYLELIAAPMESFEDEFLTFQDSVQVDGVPMFADADVDDLITIIEG
jgi:hypothetical protein